MDMRLKSYNSYIGSCKGCKYISNDLIRDGYIETICLNPDCDRYGEDIRYLNFECEDKDDEN